MRTQNEIDCAWAVGHEYHLGALIGEKMTFEQCKVGVSLGFIKPEVLQHFSKGTINAIETRNI